MQLQKHRQQTLSTLDTSQEAKELFDNIKCCSETEKLPDKSLIKIPLPWRSSKFNLLAQKLDKIHVHKKINTKGPKYIQNYTIENLCAVSTSTTPYEFFDVPRNLPINCYTPDYFHTLTETQKLLLNLQPPIDLDTLLKITEISCELTMLFLSDQVAHH